MTRLKELLYQKARYRNAQKTMDKHASFDTEEGNAYARILVKLVMIEMEIEGIQKDVLQDASL